MNTTISTNEQQAWTAATEHAWRYFELHAGQRMTIFNFFTFLAALLAAGIAATLQTDSAFAPFGLVLGPLLALLSFVFWKLDQRVSFLIKHAENVLAQAEAKNYPVDAQLFVNEPASITAAQADRSQLSAIWTFGTAFRIVFVVAGLIGLASGILAGLKTSGILLEPTAKTTNTGAKSSETSVVPAGACEPT